MANEFEYLRSTGQRHRGLQRVHLMTTLATLERTHVTRSATGPCLVVMYHYVRDRAGPITRGVRGLSVEAFERQLDELTAWGEPVDGPMLADWLTGEGDIPRRAFALTFDDGLLDHVEVAAPILQRRGLTGTFFVPGRVLVEPCVLPAHQTHLLMGAVGVENLEQMVRRAWRAAAAKQAGAPEPDPQIDEAAARAAYPYETPAAARLKTLLMRVIPPDVRCNILDALFAEHVGSRTHGWRRWYVSREQARDLAGAGHVLGGHGYSHEPLASLSHDALESDLARMRCALEGLTGRAPQVMSYPYGSVNAGVRRAVHAAGVRLAMATRSRLARWGEDALAVPRVDTIHVSAAICDE